MDSPSWRENPDWIPGKNWNGVTRLERKPGLDSWQKLEWIHPVGAKTRTGFLAKTGMESPGWSENPDWIPGKNWNGVTRLERKPGLDYPGKLEWIHPVGAKTRTGLPRKTGMDLPGWSKNPDWIPGKNWNGVTRLEQKPGLDSWQKLEWIHPVGAKTRTGLPRKTGMDSPGWSENPDWITPENWNGFTRLEQKPGLDSPRKTGMESPGWIPLF
ncbi:hypothetical protein DUI87_15312 [Hirundo rustica rustica]|uniref:Uncharacterized protein n=1 Tax=Hirundo rustica rustica TaxID=333673 RepID=A0A3M0K3R9_HIRRU|nr:hypothetical protein DUI87_15312 [Hirundo rustica rustica]